MSSSADIGEADLEAQGHSILEHPSIIELATRVFRRFQPLRHFEHNKRPASHTLGSAAPTVKNVKTA